MMETNTHHEEKLKTYMRRNNVSGEHLTFSESTRSVAETANVAGVTPQDFVKNICMIDSNRKRSGSCEHFSRGGSVIPLVKIRPSDLLRANGGEVVRLRK